MPDRPTPRRARRSLATLAAAAGAAALVLGTAATATALMTVTVIDRVSLTDADTEANDYSQNPSQGISADGRYVVFASSATDLVAGDTNGYFDIFVRDTVAGTTVRVNVGPLGAEADGNSSSPSISADGNWVSFRSEATDLLGPGIDLNGAVADVFVHDRTAGTTSLVSVPSAAASADNNSSRSAISADGHYIAFDSLATNLVAGDTNGGNDVFLRDTVADTTVRLSESTSGVQGNGDSLYPSISTDGAYVVFQSYAATLLDGGGDTNGTADVLRHTVASGSTIRVSVATGGVQSAGLSIPYSASISSDGTVVVFQSGATNLATTDANGSYDVFHHVLATGETTLVSGIGGGVTGNAESFYPALSPTGSYVVFSSLATDLVAGDGNGVPDVFRAFIEDDTAAGPAGPTGPVLPPTGTDASGVIAATGGALLLAVVGSILLLARRTRRPA